MSPKVFVLLEMIYFGKWFEPRSLSRLCGLIVRVRVVPRRTVVGDIDQRFDNMSGSHHQSHVNCVSSAYGIYICGQLSRDVICLYGYRKDNWDRNIYAYTKNIPDCYMYRKSIPDRYMCDNRKRNSDHRM